MSNQPQTCGTCGEEKQCSEYALDPANRAGVSRTCKLCYNTNRQNFKISVDVYKCRCCGLEKPANGFYREKTSSTGIKSKCKACRKLSAAAKKYGITEQEAERLYASNCAICGKPGQHIDHCHTTGEVRGILCNNCNKGIGHFFDDPEAMLKAAKYLEGSLCEA